MQPRFLSVARIVLLLAVFAGAGLLTAAGEEQTASTAASAAKIDQLLGASSYKFVKKTDTVWYIPYHGKSLQDFKVVLAVQDDELVTFVTVVTKAQMQLTPEFMEKLLTYDSSFDRVKIGLDTDGDLFVRCDSTVRILDLTEFKAVVSQVATATDELYQGIRPLLISD